MNNQTNNPVRIVVDNRDGVSADTLAAFIDLGTHTEEAVETLASYGKEIVTDLGTGPIPEAELSGWIADGRIEDQRDRYATVRTLELFGVRAIDRDPLPYPNLPAPPDNLHNWSADTWGWGVQQHPFLEELFDGIVVSGQERVAKPDPQLLEILNDRFGLDSTSTVYIDDSPANIATASRLGFNTHLFTTADRLHAWLAEIGLFEAP